MRNWKEYLDAAFDSVFGKPELEVSDNLTDLGIKAEHEIWAERARIERRPTAKTAFVCVTCETIQVSSRECVTCGSEALARLAELRAERIVREIPPRSGNLLATKGWTGR